MCEDFVPNIHCLNMFSVMGMFNTIKDRSPVDVMSMLSCVLDFYGIYQSEEKHSTVGAVDMINTMKDIMTKVHNDKEQMLHCEAEYEFWTNNYEELLIR